MSSGAFRFWQQWLLWACISTVVLGVTLAFFDVRLLPGFLEAVSTTLWGTATMPSDVVTYHRFAHAVLGSTIASWACVLAFVAHIPFRAREPWAWWCVLASLGVWFPLDTAMSLYFGVWPNAIFNVVALLFIGTPLIFTRSAFRGQRAVAASAVNASQASR